MPAIGLGTFGYGAADGTDGEHWNNSNVQQVRVCVCLGSNFGVVCVCMCQYVFMCWHVCMCRLVCMCGMCMLVGLIMCVCVCM